MNDMADLRERLQRAADVLDGKAREATGTNERERLQAKVSGIRLALDYMRVYPIHDEAVRV